jgi:hypothetical protein
MSFSAGYLIFSFVTAILLVLNERNEYPNMGVSLGDIVFLIFISSIPGINVMLFLSATLNFLSSSLGDRCLNRLETFIKIPSLMKKEVLRPKIGRDLEEERGWE